MNIEKKQLCAIADKYNYILKEIAIYLHENPELGNQEWKASALLKRILQEHDFTIKEAVPDEFPTSFEAVQGNGPIHIGFLAEYDALPEIGHGCGHNLIAAMSTTAAIVCEDFFKINDRFNPGSSDNDVTVHLFGCPAEETLGSKVLMSERGLFNMLDAAFIVHPGGVTAFGGTSYATHPLQVGFIGKPAHVADPEYHGINALDALVDFYGRLHKLEKNFTEPYILGKIITEGGIAPNIVPERAVLRATIRAIDVNYLEGIMLPQIKELANAVAKEHGTRLEMFHYEPLFKNMINDKQLEASMKGNFNLLGLSNEEIITVADDYADGSSDVGNVSQIVPTIQPEIKIGTNIEAHTPEFANAAGSEYAQEMALLAVKALCMTAYDVVVSKSSRNG